MKKEIPIPKEATEWYVRRWRKRWEGWNRERASCCYICGGDIGMEHAFGVFLVDYGRHTAITCSESCDGLFVQAHEVGLPFGFSATNRILKVEPIDKYCLTSDKKRRIEKS